MLACNSTQPLPAVDTEQYFGCAQDWHHSYSGCAAIYQHSKSASSAGFRSPLLDLSNLQIPARSLPCTPADRTQMSALSTATRRDGGRIPSSSSNEQCIPSQDAGLGITTDETSFNQPCEGLSLEHDPFEADVFQSRSAEQEARRNLASPFEGYSSTPASSWQGSYPYSALSEGNPPLFAHTPEPALLHLHQTSLPPQFVMSPADYFPDSNDTSSQQHDHPSRPIFRHNSASSAALPQTGQYSYYIPTVEASPLRWTPQTSTPDWHGAQHHGNTPLLPAVMLDYSACTGPEQSPPFIPSHATSRTVATVPQRRKPRLRPSLSESCVPRMHASARSRAVSAGQFLQTPVHEYYATGFTAQQLPLPTLPPSVLINTPRPSNHNNETTSTPARSYRSNRSNTSTPQQRRRPASPPLSDFISTNMPHLVPVRQEPTFHGDLYTPRYKRRTSNGRWEGWCGYCLPGRWLDLKNSRYWEDKLRNHGICAKTKRRFTEPEQIRWVGIDGSVVAGNGLGLDTADTYLDQRKREGLCGVCKSWIAMDGTRTKAKDRAVGWWMHAYKVRLAMHASKSDKTDDGCSVTITRKLPNRTTFEPTIQGYNRHRSLQPHPGIA